MTSFEILYHVASISSRFYFSRCWSYRERIYQVREPSTSANPNCMYRIRIPCSRSGLDVQKLYTRWWWLLGKGHFRDNADTFTNLRDVNHYNRGPTGDICNGIGHVWCEQFLQQRFATVFNYKIWYDYWLNYDINWDIDLTAYV